MKWKRLEQARIYYLSWISTYPSGHQNHSLTISSTAGQLELSIKKFKSIIYLLIKFIALIYLNYSLVY